MNTIIGRVTKNAEINILKNDKQVVNFSIAVNDSYSSKGERVEHTTYYNCSYFINAKIAQYLTKGSLVELQGRTTSHAWIGKDGEIRSGLNFHTSHIKFHGGGKRDEVQSATTEKQQGKKTIAGDTDDDLPF